MMKPGQDYVAKIPRVGALRWRDTAAARRAAEKEAAAKAEEAKPER